MPMYIDPTAITSFFTFSARTPEEAFARMVALSAEASGDEGWYPDWDYLWCSAWEQADVSELECFPCRDISNRTFVLIEETASEIVRRLRAAADESQRGWWLRKYAKAVERGPDDIQLRARALVNLDSSFLSPNAPFGCIPAGDGKWLFFDAAAEDSENIGRRHQRDDRYDDEDCGGEDGDEDEDREEDYEGNVLVDGDDEAYWRAEADDIERVLRLATNPWIRAYLRQSLASIDEMADGGAPSFDESESADSQALPQIVGDTVPPEDAGIVFAAWARYCAEEAERLLEFAESEFVRRRLMICRNTLRLVTHEPVEDHWRQDDLPRRCSACYAVGPKMQWSDSNTYNVWFRCWRCGLHWPRDFESILALLIGLPGFDPGTAALGGVPGLSGNGQNR